MRVKDLAEHDRPRERLLAHGAAALADRELLALLLGAGTTGTDAIELAARLIARHDGLPRLATACPHELLQVPGVGPAKAARVAAAFEFAQRAAVEVPRRRIASSADLAAASAPFLRGLRHERVVLIACDSAGAVLRTSVLTEGSSDGSLVPVRDVLRSVLSVGAAAFGLAHNHPSGNLTPSVADRQITERLREAGETVGLRFLDHVIVTDSAWRRITADR